MRKYQQYMDYPGRTMYARLLICFVLWWFVGISSETAGGRLFAFRLCPLSNIGGGQRAGRVSSAPGSSVKLAYVEHGCLSKDGAPKIDLSYLLSHRNFWS